MTDLNKNSSPKTIFNWRHQYDAEADARAGAAAATKCEDESRTQQQFTEDCDINVIARRFGLDKAPMLPAVTDPSYYGDVSNVPDLRAVLDMALDARAKFMMLPARLRARFDNQPGRMWAFLQDPENMDEAVRLGLLVRREDPPPVQPAVDTVAKGNDSGVSG